MWGDLDDYCGYDKNESEGSENLNIAVDFDNTYTADPELWDIFIRAAMDRGHTVYCVSARPEKEMNKPKRTIGLLIGDRNCFGTCFEPKKEFMKSKGIHINIWVDDSPEMIVDDLIFNGRKE
jgi:hypothetical protein